MLVEMLYSGIFLNHKKGDETFDIDIEIVLYYYDIIREDRITLKKN